MRNEQPIPPDTGDIVIGLSPKTRGHWNIASIDFNEDGTIRVKFIDHWDDEPFEWMGTIEQYHQSFVYELDYNERA